MKNILTNKSTRKDFITYGMVIILYAVFQILINQGAISSSLQGQLVPICVYIVMAVSLNLVVGISGELSLGHAGFMSVGAFSGVVAATCLQNLIPAGGLRLVASVIIAGIIAAIAGVVIGVPVLRLRGDYLAIVTLAFGEIIKNILNNLYIGLDAEGLHISMKSAAEMHMTAGTVIINGPMGAVGIQKLSTFFAGFVLIMVCLIVVLNLIRSRTGRAIMAIRDNRIAAESVGINATRYKLTAFVTAAALAGMAGALYAMNYSTIVPKKFDFNTSILILVFVVLGGLANIRGSIIAATILTVLPEVLRSFNDYRMLIYAIVLIVVMLGTNNPTLKASIQRITGRFSKKQKAAPAAAAEGGASDD